MKIGRGTVALVTGATGGVGGAIARALHGAGMDLILSGRRRADLERLAGELGARSVVADLSVPSDVARLCDEAGPVDVLVANAALPASGELLGYSEAEIDRALGVNLRSPILLARRLGEGMAARRRGQIVFISSLMGKLAGPGTALYAATKFGLRGLSLGLREDLRSVDVGVTTIFPGFIRDVGMFAETGVKLPKGVGMVPASAVANAVLRAVRENPAEIDVATLEQRLSVLSFALVPTVFAWAQRKLGAAELARAAGEAQRAKR